MTIHASAPGIADALARVREITTALRPPPPPAPPPGFSGTLDAAMGAGPAGAPVAPGVGATMTPVGAAPAPAAGGGPVGQRIAAIATAEVGVAEEPPGSNDGARIAQYRTATRGAGVGPWCAYFASWVAAQAGVPIGPEGSGLGYVPTVKQWAEQTGRYVPAGAGPPQVGDLVVFDRDGDGVLDHMGMVTGVRPDGGIDTVEGNSSDAVSARSYGPGAYAGLVRLG